MGIFNYDFMINAFLAILVISPLFALIGTMIVSHKMAFFSDALGHSALTGVALGALIGISNYSVSMIIFAIIFALILNQVKYKSENFSDTIISVFSSTAIAIGLALLSKYGGINKYTSYLVGDILSITKEEIMLLVITLIVVFVIWLVLSNKLVALSVSKTISKTKGMNTFLIDNIFSILIAVIVMLTIRWIGILLINSLLILPAASSKNVSRNLREYTLKAVIFSMFSGVSGIFASFYLSVATGPMIVIVSAIIYFVTLILGRLKKQV